MLGRIFSGRERSEAQATQKEGEGGAAQQHGTIARVEKTDEEWKKELGRMEYRVLRQKGTERPGSGQYNKFYPGEGHFKCAACDNPLYSAKAKFDSGCGWPAFDKCYAGAIRTKVDNTFGTRTEILCAACDGHLGHVFRGERFTDTNERHCVNSVSVKYDKGDHSADEKPLTGK